ncbi:MAG: alpha/beta hydrolase [Candidatus Hodarchaeales archaeon]
MKLFYLIKSYKKRTGLIISLLMVFAGFFPAIVLTYWADPYNPYTIQQVTLESGDDTKLTSLVYTPLDVSGNRPGIILAHGFSSDKSYMSSLGIELVKRGFIVVVIDFRGHGSSDGYLEGHPDGLYLDMMAAADYLDNLGNIHDRIGLVGHSMGGGASLNFAYRNTDKIEAMVAIGSGFPSIYNSSTIPNLLIATGQFEQGYYPERALVDLRDYTGDTNVEFGRVYGDFANRNASMAVLSPTSDHLREVHDYTIIYETVQWFERAFNGDIASDVTLNYFISIGLNYRQFFHRLSLIGVVALLFVLIIYISNYIFKNEFVFPERNILKGFSTKKLVIYYILVSVIGLISSQLLTDFFQAAMPVSSGEQLFPLMVGNTFGIIILFFVLTFRNEEQNIKDLYQKIKELSSINPERSLVYGILVTLLAIALVTAITHWISRTTVLTSREIGTIITITILFFPFMFVKESYFRMVQGQLNLKNRIDEYFTMTGIGILMDTGIFALFMILGLMVLNMSVLISITIILQVLTTWVYMHSGRNTLGSTVFHSMFYAWLIIQFFPFGLVH